MRHRRWVEFLKENDFELRYHSCKTNVVVDALCRKSLHISHLKIHELDLIESFKDLNLKMTPLHGGVHLNQIEISCDLRSQIRQPKS